MASIEEVPTRRASAKGLRTFTMNIDETFDKTLEELKSAFGKSSKADAVKLGLALLRIAAEGRKHDWKLTLSDKDDKVVKEIVLP